jgi:hypothetical protein
MLDCRWTAATQDTRKAVETVLNYVSKETFSFIVTRDDASSIKRIKKKHLNVYPEFLRLCKHRVTQGVLETIVQIVVNIGLHSVTKL